MLDVFDLLREEVDLLLDEVAELPTDDLPALVEAAALADHLRRRLVHLVSAGREAVRSKALAEPAKAGKSISFEGMGSGRALVVVSPPRWEVSPNADLPRLQRQLGAQFTLFFEQRGGRWVLRKDAPREILAAEEPVRKLLLGSVLEKQDAPQVAFEYRPPTRQ